MGGGIGNKPFGVDGEDSLGHGEGALVTFSDVSFILWETADPCKLGCPCDEPIKAGQGTLGEGQ